MPRDQEQHRVVAERVADDRVDHVPRPPEIEHQRARIEDVRQQPVEHGRPYDGMVLLQAHDVDGKRDHVRAARKGDAGDHVEADPKAPRVVLVQVRDRAETVDEAHHQNADSSMIVGIEMMLKGVRSGPFGHISEIRKRKIRRVSETCCVCFVSVFVAVMTRTPSFLLVVVGEQVQAQQQGG